MNKYTIKILDLINNNLYKIKHKIDISLFENNYNKIKNMKYEYKQNDDKMINKLHDISEITLLELFFVKIFPDIVKKMNFDDWYKINRSKYDLEKILNDEDSKLLYNPKNDRNELHKLLYTNLFISLDIIKHAESSNLLFRQITYKNSDITLYLTNINKTPDIQIICMIIEYMKKLFNDDKYLKLIVFYGDQKKYLSNNKYISFENVNSGVTIHGGDDDCIMIWRREEFYKIFIHELIHYYGVDFYVSDKIYNEINNIFKTYFKINGIDRVNESYTETLAIVINSLLYSKLYDKPFIEIINDEISYSHFQIAKILHHFKYTQINSIYDIILYQHTSVCSYYIIKCMMLCNIDKMIQFWNEYGFFVSKNTDKYLELYKYILKNNNLDINTINYWLLKIDSIDDKSFIRNTMRMSVYQL